MDIFRHRLALRIEWLKETENISEAEIARRLEMDPRRFNKYKTTEREMTYDLLVKTCYILKTSPNYLLGVDDNPEWPREKDANDLSMKLDEILKKL